MSRHNASATVILLAFSIPIFAASCFAPIGSSKSRIEVTLGAPAAMKAITPASREIPSTMDGIYMQLVGEAGVAYSTRIGALPGDDVTIRAEVSPGTYDAHVFALKGNVITGIALQNDVVLVDQATTSLVLTMSPLTFSGPSNVSSLGPGNPAAQAVSRSVSGIPTEFLPYLVSGTTRLRGKLDAAPTAPDDATVDLEASSTTSGSARAFSASVPAGTAVGNQSLYYWFTTTWPGCDAVLADALPADASYLRFNGATLSGNVAGDHTIAPVLFEAEQGANVSLMIGVPVIYTTATDALGNYLFGSVSPNIYSFLIDISNSAKWSFISSVEKRIDGNLWSTISEPAYYPDISYTGLTLAPGTITTLDFRFTGY